MKGLNKNDTYTIARYCVYNLESIISSFGKKPEKIIIEYQRNPVNSNLENAEVTTFALDYNF